MARTYQGKWRAALTACLVVGLAACGVETKDDPPAPLSDEARREAPEKAPEAKAPEQQLVEVGKDVPRTITPKGDDGGGGTDSNHEEFEPTLKAIAIEGEEAPGTGGQRFVHDEFETPQVNDHKNVAFVGEYAPYYLAEQLRVGQLPGEGVFFWKEGHLSPVALTGTQTDGGYLGGDFEYVELNIQNQVAFTSNLFRVVALNGGVSRIAENGDEEGTDALGAPAELSPEQAAALEAEADALNISPIVLARFNALVQATPWDSWCKRFDLDIIAKSGDPAPGGGRFYELKHPSQIDGYDYDPTTSDIAFQASFFSDAMLTREQAPDLASVMALTYEGIFLWLADIDELVAVARPGTEIEGTGGLRLCTGPESDLVRGPWMNNDGVITFKAMCLEDEHNVRHPELEGSVIIVRPTEMGLGTPELFLAIGSPAPRQNCDICNWSTDSRPVIRDIETGRRGLSDEEMVALISVEDGLLYYQMIIAKDLDDTPLNHAGDLRVCAADGMDLGNGYTLDVGDGEPTIAACGTVAFEADIEGWERNYPVDLDAVLTCQDKGDLTILALEGEKMPVGERNRFDDLDEVSNSDKFVVFTEDGDEPTGVYLSTSP